MLVSRRELARLERELARAHKRADDAEERLAAERQRHDWKDIQLLSRAVTKAGGYGLEETKPELVEPKQHPKGFTHEPTAEDLDVLNFYKVAAAEAGKDESDAVQKWEAHMRGENLFIDTEM
jgi:hypothetical protein